MTNLARPHGNDASILSCPFDCGTRRTTEALSNLILPFSTRETEHALNYEPTIEERFVQLIIDVTTRTCFLR